jgi:hypothetical protein
MPQQTRGQNRNRSKITSPPPAQQEHANMPWLSGQATIAYGTGAEEERNSQRRAHRGGSRMAGMVASSSSQPRLWTHVHHRPVGHDVEATAARPWSSDHRQGTTATSASGSAGVAELAVQPAAKEEIRRGCAEEKR